MQRDSKALNLRPFREQLHPVRARGTPTPRALILTLAWLALLLSLSACKKEQATPTATPTEVGATDTSQATPSTTPVPGPSVGAGPFIPHTPEGRSDCLACHEQL